MEISSLGKLKKVEKRHVPSMSQQTGFPSPATHYMEPDIDLNKELITHRDATFFIRVDGDALAEHNILHNDVLIIDRSLKPKINQLVLIVSEGEFKVIRFPALSSEIEFTLWGVITYIIHYAFVDCNSFYASCEQFFRPDLWGKPVVVLSNNDGCVIAANKEAKALSNIPMFEPVFKIKEQLVKNKVTFFSSNYTLYGEMSQRVMNILKTFSPKVEIYSIDEAFLDVSGMDYFSLETYGQEMKNTIYRNTGLPVGVGIAPTKVLAKLANRIAKKKAEENKNVFVIDSEEKRIEALQWSKIKDVWGIGRQHAKRLQNIGVQTAYDFTQVPLAWIRKEMSVVGERT